MRAIVVIAKSSYRFIVVLGRIADARYRISMFQSQYTSTNNSSQTTSTNCQYQVAAWNAN